jgi:hypothetical protein
MMTLGSNRLGTVVQCLFTKRTLVVTVSIAVPVHPPLGKQINGFIAKILNYSFNMEIITGFVSV